MIADAECCNYRVLALLYIIFSNAISFRHPGKDIHCKLVFLGVRLCVSLCVYAHFIMMRTVLDSRKVSFVNEAFFCVLAMRFFVQSRLNVFWAFQRAPSRWCMQVKHDSCQYLWWIFCLNLLEGSVGNTHRVFCSREMCALQCGCRAIRHA